MRITKGKKKRREKYLGYVTKLENCQMYECLKTSQYVQ